MKARAIASLTLVATIAIALLVVLGDGAAAKDKDDFLPTFRATYPAAAGTRLDSCSLCHFTNSNGKWDENQYAEDFEEADKDFAAVQALDSDGDGFTNYQEIQAGTLPGVASDNPDTVVTTTTIAAPTGSGEAIYQANCAGCHGGNGGNLVPTSLTLSQLVNTTAKGTTGMNGFSGTLTSAEIDLVAGYLFNWSGTPTPTTTTILGTVPNGAEVWAQSCAGCHGANGGNLVGRGLSSGQVASVTAAGTSGMPGFSSSLSTAQIDAVSAYVASLAGVTPTTNTVAPGAPPPSGAAVFAESCAACHGAAGGDLIGHSLSSSQLLDVTANGRGAMPGFSDRLSTEHIGAVVAYLASIGGTTPSPDSAEVDGAALYTTHCSACHGAAAEGGSGGPLAGTELAQSEFIWLTTAGRGDMPAFVGRLAPDEVAAITDFVLSISPLPDQTNDVAETEDDETDDESEEGRSLFVDEGSGADPARSPLIVGFLILGSMAIVGGVGTLWLKSARELVQ
ncbi:MAG: c-type cytochrome [Acidimicrobiia bacterium]|nr:c-type cytochrome [Acidimicrobiia bacterium]